MLAAHPLIGRPSLNNWAGVNGTPRSQVYSDHLPSLRPPSFLIGPPLKVFCNENQGGYSLYGQCQLIFVCLLILKLFFSLCFSVSAGKAKLICDIYINRQNSTARSIYFSLL
jgi:hypothetical protein